jgi:hypothetical protein
MLMNIITPTTERIFVVTDVKSNDKVYFLREERISEVFNEESGDNVVWAAYANSKTTHVINGVYMEPKDIDKVVKADKLYEYWFSPPLPA